ncbi:glycosyltransferase family 1 protein [Isoptericola halotolerans]|uniref:Glycosyltransferase involved in cell wall biosynthesis n=1 Tax=Isoptericola halotolerans TaxID=300560 RepID=A0ABX2A699_9MICO|nr:glycosyltransferase involved in cell wall biosynthesis [Isoptericola halotolerans]
MEPVLTLASFASALPMGPQAYEENVARRAQAAVGDAVRVRRALVRTLRSDLPGTARLPGAVLRGTVPGSRRAAGRWLYRGAAVVHRMGLSMPPAPVPEVVTVHDTVAWRYPDEAAPEPYAAEETRRAEAVIAVSQFSADDIAERFGLDRVHVVHNGVDAQYFDVAPAAPADLAAAGVRGRYVLHAGGATARKNLEGLADAWPSVRAAVPDVRLVMCGPPAARRDRLFGALDGVVRLGRVPDGVLPGLMAAADAVVVPSLHEGFGLPALEAMACGVPVVAADRAALPEVCGGAAWLVEPDGPGLADGLVHVLEGGAGVADRVAAGRDRAATFTWEASAAGHARVWRSLLGHAVPG